MATSYDPVLVKHVAVKQGAITTLAALGAYDKFVVCDPQRASFPAQSFARHTNFSVAFQLRGIPNAPLGSQFWERGRTVQFSFDKTERSADLIGPTFLHCHWNRIAAAAPLVSSTDLIAYVNELGNAVVDTATFLVGNTPVESHTSEALHCMSEFGVRGAGLNEASMLGKFSTTLSPIDDPTTLPVTTRAWSTANRHTYTPLNFHFCHEKEEYFPLVAVQYQDPVIELSLRGKLDLIRAVTAASPNVIIQDSLVQSRFEAGDYVGGDLLAMDIGYTGIYLDTDERRTRAQNPHSYVFQYVNCKEKYRVQQNDKKLEVKLNYENATSSYWWFYRRDSITRPTTANGAVKDYFDFSTRQPFNSIPPNVGGVAEVYTPLNPFAVSTIYVNNNVRVTGDGVFFNQVNPYIARTNRLPSEPSFVNSFNFGTNAAQWNHDNGSQNDSKIDNLVFEFTFENSDANGAGVATNNGLAETGTVYVYANKFSVAKISGGQFGLAFTTI